MNISGKQKERSQNVKSIEDLIRNFAGEATILEEIKRVTGDNDARFEFIDVHDMQGFRAKSGGRALFVEWDYRSVYERDGMRSQGSALEYGNIPHRRMTFEFDDAQGKLRFKGTSMEQNSVIVVAPSGEIPFNDGDDVFAQLERMASMQNQCAEALPDLAGQQRFGSDIIYLAINGNGEFKTVKRGMKSYPVDLLPS